ncbi:hypothetical protein Taro_042332 [Colocasia esculenta]|uniref:Copper transport protein n=1 Tax=Colocasia esculenta TaxID=4460 RepID=A0A843X2D6_COLES|nr:hypothetical protein [Colocasia esculenta]
MMHMAFYWGRKVTLLFDWWRTKSWIGYTVTVVAVFLVAAFYQYMEARRLRFKALTLLEPATVLGPTPVTSMEAPLLGFSAARRAATARVAAAVLFGINSAIGYILMLAVMSYNSGVFAAVVVGQAIGYLVFRSGGEEHVMAVGKPCACS